MQRMAEGHVRIFDTTLRDGEQSPGASMTVEEKLEAARELARLGVDVIEAGFPAASPDDLRAVHLIGRTVGSEDAEGREPPIVCGLARAVKDDLDKAWEAVRGARHPRIHTFLATSPIHREHKLRLSCADVLARIRERVAYARSLCEDVEFSPEDAGRTEPEFLYEALAAALEAGATTLNIPDTVGYTMPDEFGALLAGIRRHVPGIERAILSVHCHNDLGLATANTLAGIRNGARQVEVTVNGIGERAGNTSLEEVVMALHTRRAHFGLSTRIDTTCITRASRLVSRVTGIPVQPNKAVVGANAFAHEAGIHQDGMLKHQQTYEIMQPQTVGAARSRLVLGKHSGRHAFAVGLEELGYPLRGEALDKAFARFKDLADKKKIITDADLVALASDELYQPEEHFSLEALQVACGSTGLPTATLRIRDRGQVRRTAAAVGTGPVDAVFKAIDQVVRAPVVLLEYAVQSITEGIDALGEVSVRIRAASGAASLAPQLNPQRDDSSARVYHGHGSDTDIIVASAKAYMAALNRLLTASGAVAGDAAAGDATPSEPAPPQPVSAVATQAAAAPALSATAAAQPRAPAAAAPVAAATAAS